MSKRSLFISYNHRDAGLAKTLEKDLEGLGFDASNPEREVPPGEGWRAAIQAAIKRSDALIVIASPHNLSSSWTSYEVGIAEALGKPVVVLLPDRHSVTELPEEINRSQVVGFDPRSPKRAAQDIVARLAA